MVIISPWSKKLEDGKLNPKDYPYWQELVRGIDEEVIQVGVPGEAQLVKDCRFGLSLRVLGELLKTCRTWISVDNFFPHFAHHFGVSGTVLWGMSDPRIFGYPENRNILKNKRNLRDNQFWIWKGVEPKLTIWATADFVLGDFYRPSLSEEHKRKISETKKELYRRKNEDICRL